MSDRQQGSPIVEGPLTKAMLKVIWPMVFSSQIELLVGVILLFWIARLGGSSGLEVFVLLTPPLRVVGLLVSGTLSSGMGALVAQSVGARDGKGIAILRGTLKFALIATLAIVVPGILLAWPITDALASGGTTPAELREFYLPWLIGFPMLVIADLFLDTIIATGWTTFGLARVLLDLAFVFALTPVLMEVFDLGMLGPPAAAATSHALLAVLIWRALRVKAQSLGLGPINSRDTAGDRALWRKVTEIGLPPQLGRIATFTAQAIYVQMLAREATAAVNGFGIAFQAMLVVGLMGLSVAGGGAVVIGQNMGAGKPERSIGALVRAGMFMAVVLVLFIAATPFMRPVFAVFSDDDPATADAALRAVRIMCWGQIGVAAFQLLIASYTAVGATKAAGFFVIVSEVIGVVFAIAYDGPALEAVAYAYCLSAGIKAVMLLALVPRALLRPLADAKRARDARVSSPG